ncbi:MAG: hypothetical protein ACFFFK_10635 [Candidatus Thorarchaeota archaeon]
MQDSPEERSHDIQGIIGIIIPMILLGFVAIFVPFVVLNNLNPPPYYPPPPGWESSVTIYLWAARFTSAFFQVEYGVGGVTNLNTIPFVIMMALYFLIHIAVGLRKIPARYGAGIDVLILIVWISVCHLIYGTLEEWSLIQMPVFPIVGLSMLLLVYGSQVFQLSPTAPASSSFLSAS